MSAINNYATSSTSNAEDVADGDQALSVTNTDEVVLEFMHENSTLFENLLNADRLHDETSTQIRYARRAANAKIYLDRVYYVDGGGKEQDIKLPEGGIQSLIIKMKKPK